MTDKQYHIIVKKVSDFTVPSRDVTNQTLPRSGIIYMKYSNSQPGLVTSRLGTGKPVTFFYNVAVNDFVQVP